MQNLLFLEQEIRMQIRNDINDSWFTGKQWDTKAKITSFLEKPDYQNKIINTFWVDAFLDCVISYCDPTDYVQKCILR